MKVCWWSQGNLWNSLVFTAVASVNPCGASIVGNREERYGDSAPESRGAEEKVHILQVTLNVLNITSNCKCVSISEYEF